MTKRPTPSRSLLQNDDVSLKSGRIRKRDPRQPQLPFDPMPERVEPCLAQLKAKPPVGPEWSWEIKWDGYRLAIHVGPDGAKLITRGGHDWTHRFPAIAEAARTIAPATMILDGEAVVLDEQGRPDFGLLQNSLGGRGGNLPSRNAVFYAFDILYLDGHDLRGVEYSSRRHLLEDVLSSGGDVILLSNEFDADPEDLLAHACERGLEGIIGKHRDRPYRSGRLGDWVKVKCVRSDSFAIIGYQPSTALPGAIASLLLAARKGGEWHYVGNVGTGFKHEEARLLKRQLDALKTSKPAVKVPGRKLVLTEPVLIAEIEYRAWTDEMKLRHASYKGLREFEDHAEIYRLPE